jgi:hypothetical protein
LGESQQWGSEILSWVPGDTNKQNKLRGP